MFHDELRFLRGALARPRSVGAIAPSSPALARAIAAQIDPILPGKVLELGPGTGVVTQAIVDMGIVPERLVMIEFDPHFATLLAERFGSARVIEGDAFDLAKTLGSRGAPFAAIVSGLPLLNQPPQRRKALIDTALDRLLPGAPFIQFSYGLKPPVLGTLKAPVQLGAFVWRNLPPARVWVYRRA
ncbi:MAG TPA: rRNA adenine N-6-methyltransferase family protein [Rhizomicrobium sp.]|nr:rRNA adenine N-6-methyltransferase family protein [Rhizomicrobium sp.]